jgi:hypothetical protein
MHDPHAYVMGYPSGANMNYVEALAAPERNIGQIKLYDRDQAFAAAGRAA